MKISDIIRTVLDLVDAAEQPVQARITAVDTDQPVANDDSDLVRMKQIAGLLDTHARENFENEPNEKYSGIEAVLASGDDVHKSKNPADMRSDSVSMYPMYSGKP
jgi:hypothetical protein